MSAYKMGSDNPTDLPKRAVGALTEKMSVLPDTGRVSGANDLYLVVSESGSEYLVDAREGRCDCPDAQHNLGSDEQCKHERRVRYAIRDTSIPTWIDYDAIDPLLGAHTPDPVTKTNGGTIIEDKAEGCLHGEEWCPGPEASILPCFNCYCDCNREERTER